VSERHTNKLVAFLVHVEIPEFCGGGHREVHVLAVGVEAAKVEASARVVREFGEAARGWPVVACVRATGAVVRQGVAVPGALKGIRYSACAPRLGIRAMALGASARAVCMTYLPPLGLLWAMLVDSVTRGEGGGHG